jgi:hypothetical protein
VQLRIRRYRHIATKATAIWLDFGVCESVIAMRRNDGGKVALVTISPGKDGVAFVVAEDHNKHALVLCDAQYEYASAKAGSGGTAACGGRSPRRGQALDSESSMDRRVRVRVERRAAAIRLASMLRLRAVAASGP